MERRGLRHEDFTVGWVCALPCELATAKAMLDEELCRPPSDSNDPNTYTLGRIWDHNVVITCLPTGTAGITSAAEVSYYMRATVPCIRFGLMVGVGGGVPRTDVRLGDVVASSAPGEQRGGVQYDLGTGTPRR